MGDLQLAPAAYIRFDWDADVLSEWSNKKAEISYLRKDLIETAEPLLWFNAFFALCYCLCLWGIICCCGLKGMISCADAVGQLWKQICSLKMECMASRSWKAFAFFFCALLFLFCCSFINRRFWINSRKSISIELILIKKCCWNICTCYLILTHTFIIKLLRNMLLSSTIAGDIRTDVFLSTGGLSLSIKFHWLQMYLSSSFLCVW